MTILVPNNGEGDALSAFVNKSTLSDLILRVFKNNITPSETDTAATYTEADFSGYAAATLTGASWTISEGAPSQASYAQQTFTRNATGAAQTVYGIYMTRSSGGRIALAELDPAGPFTLTNNGDVYKYTPQVTAD